MSTRELTTTTIRKLQEDDLARRAALLFQRDPSITTQNNNPMMLKLAELADHVMSSGKMPETAGEWLSLVMFYGHNDYVLGLRQQAEQNEQPCYFQVRQWMQLLDNSI